MFDHDPMGLSVFGAKNKKEFEAAADDAYHLSRKTYDKMLDALRDTGVKNFKIAFALPISVPLELTGKGVGIVVEGVLKLTLWLIRDGQNAFLSTTQYVDHTDSRVAYSRTNN